MGKESTIHTQSEIPLSEIEVDPEKYNVLASVYDIRPLGRDLPKFIVKSALDGKRLGYFGSSGVGKTTLMTQVIACARENARNLGVVYDHSMAQYDLVLSATKDKDEGDQFNKELEEAFSRVKNFENVGVGRTDVKNRGKKALHKKIKKMAAGEDTNTILIGLPQVLTNQIHSSYLRAEIENMHPDELFAYMETHNIDVQGIPKTRLYAAGIIEKYQEMGKRDHIEAIGKEEDGLIAEWALAKQVREMRYGGDNPPSILEERASGLVVPSTLNADVIRKIYSDFGMPEDFSDFTVKKAVESFTAQAIRMEYVFQDEYGIGPDRGIIAASPWQSGKVVLDLSPYFHEAA